MLTPCARQRSFYDADSVCEQLIPEDSFYRKFREIVAPLIEDSMFESMYCLDNGRPPISPSLLAMACILQFYRNLSDREMERACMYDIEVKFALGLRLDERPFDHSSLGDFRKRLLDNGKEKEIFDRILGELVARKLIRKNEIQRVDATHVIADIALPTMVTLVKKGIRDVLKTLGKRHRKVLEQLSQEINLSEYGRHSVNDSHAGKNDLERRSERLVVMVGDARKVIESTKGIKGDHILGRRVDTLRRILNERIMEDENGALRERKGKNLPKDVLVSPVDMDARYGAKSRTKKFAGYKANVTETVESRFITSITAMSGNRRDAATLVDAITEQKKFDLVPPKLIGDTAYGDGYNRKELAGMGCKLVAPLEGSRFPEAKRVYSISRFRYDETLNVVTCPAGVTVGQSGLDRRQNRRVFHFPAPTCHRCRRRNRCTRSADGRRTVSIGRGNNELRAAERYNQGKRFKKDMLLRPPIEAKLAELKRWHGLTRTRYRGLDKVGLQFYFTAVAVNIKRWIKLELEKSHPKLAMVGP